MLCFPDILTSGKEYCNKILIRLLVVTYANLIYK